MAIIFTIGLNLVGTKGQGAGPVIAGMVTCLMVPFMSWSAYKAMSSHNARPAAWAAKAATTIKSAIAAIG
jgi:hypothetical protein